MEPVSQSSWLQSFSKKLQLFAKKNIEILLSITILVALSFTVRFIFLDMYPAPPGSDFGNYLTIVNIIKGYDVTGYGLRYPPLFFLMLTPLIQAMGPMLALKTMQAAVASSSCIPFFLLARRWSDWLSAFLATALFTFSQVMGEMTAWGGSANFLAITMMIFCLYFVDRAFDPSCSLKKNSLMAGIMAGLSFETHHLTAIVLASILLFFLFLTFLRGNKEKRVRNFKFLAWFATPAIVLAMPGVAIYLTIQKDLSSSLGGFGPVNLPSILGSIMYGSMDWLFSVIWVSIFILGAFAIAIRLFFKRPIGISDLLFISSLIAPFILGILLMGAAVGRVLSFMLIPLLFGFSILLHESRRLIPKLVSGLAHSRELEKGAIAFLIVGVMLISMTGAQGIGKDVNWYHTLEQADIDALDWIKENTPSDSRFATSGKMGGGIEEGNGYGWWIEGYSERTAEMSGSEQYYLFEDELESVRDMNRFYSGKHTIENGRLQVSDQYPLFTNGNPEIAVRRFGAYQSLLFLNDGTNEVKYWQSESSTKVTNCLLSYLPASSRKSISLTQNESTISIRSVTSTNEFQYVRETIIRNGEPKVEIVFHILPLGDAVLSAVNIKIWPKGNYFERLSEDDSSSKFILSDQWGHKARINATILDSNGMIAGLSFIEANPKSPLPLTTLNMSIPGNRLDLSIIVTPEESEIDQLSSLSYFNEFDILEKYGIDYLFESVTRKIDITRFQTDTEHFEVVFRNPSVVVFRVISLERHIDMHVTN